MIQLEQQGDAFEKVLQFISVPIEDWLEVKSIKTTKKINYFPISNNEIKTKIEGFDLKEILKSLQWKEQGKEEKISIVQHFFFKYIFEKTNSNKESEYFLFQKDTYKSLSFLRPYSIDYYFARCNFGSFSHEKYNPPLISFNEETLNVEIFYWGIYVSDVNKF